MNNTFILLCLEKPKTCMNCPCSSVVLSDTKKFVHCSLVGKTLVSSDSSFIFDECPCVSSSDLKSIIEQADNNGDLNPDNIAQMNYVNGWNSCLSHLSNLIKKQNEIESIHTNASQMNAPDPMEENKSSDLLRPSTEDENDKKPIHILVRHDKVFQKAVQHLKDYKAEHGNLCVPQSYVCSDGYRLGDYVHRARATFKGKRTSFLTQNDIDQLNSIGFVWDIRKYQWDIGFAHVQKYYERFGNTRITFKYDDPDDGFHTGSWFYHNWLACTDPQKRKVFYETDPDWGMKVSADKSGKQSKTLNASSHNNRTMENKEVTDSSIKQEIQSLVDQNLGIQEITCDLRVLRWAQGYNAAKKYFALCHNICVSDSYQTKSGFPLGEWLKRRREEYCNNVLSAHKIQLLDQLNMIWDKDSAKILHHLQK